MPRLLFRHHVEVHYPFGVWSMDSVRWCGVLRCARVFNGSVLQRVFWGPGCVRRAMRYAAIHSGTAEGS